MLSVNTCTTVYSDNCAGIDWSAFVMTKGPKHFNLKENYVCEARHLGLIKITHIPGIVDSSDLFIKELKNAAPFHRCHDALMVSKTHFDTCLPMLGMS
jgi:hypothetical protein